MVLYLDLIIFKEFIMDIILLVTTKTVLKKKTNSIRIIISGLIGVIETVLDLLINMNILIRIFSKIITSILMIKVIFKTKDGKEFAKEIFVFYLVSFVYAGISITIIFSETLNQFLNNGFLVGKYSNFSIILAVIIGIILIILTFKMISNNIRKDNLICDLEVGIENMNIVIKVLLDTGNLLCEPITNMPVVIVEKSKLTNILENAKNERKIYLIPYKTLGNENKVLFGIKPEYIKLIRDNTYTFKEVIIGLYDGNISNNNSYNGLVRTGYIRKRSGVIWI